MVRVLFQTALPKDGARPDLDALEKNIAAFARRWTDRFHDAVLDSSLAPESQAMAAYFLDAFNAAYREAFSPEEAMRDVSMLAILNASHPVCLRAYRQRHGRSDPRAGKNIFAERRDCAV